MDYLVLYLILINAEDVVLMLTHKFISQKKRYIVRMYRFLYSFNAAISASALIMPSIAADIMPPA